ncbi:MAG: hypothetical protein HY791_31835 [Deltaproteobacteria bacterium]|nr:hypothetical protein [Deltaproteobacteria bacterium]
MIRVRGVLGTEGLDWTGEATAVIFSTMGVVALTAFDAFLPPFLERAGVELGVYQFPLTSAFTRLHGPLWFGLLSCAVVLSSIRVARRRIILLSCAAAISVFGLVLSWEIFTLPFLPSPGAIK